MAAAHPDEQVLIRFAGGVLTPAERRDVEAHLDQCAECLALVGEAVREARDQRTRDERRTVQAAPAFERGARLGRYLVLDVIGSGGMGVVLAAYDPQLDRKVALKLVRLSAMRRERAELEPRLLREARAVAQLSHPNVVAVHDVGTFDQLPFMAMELVDGFTLRQWLERPQRTVAEVFAVLVQAGRGLLAAHHAGLVHRDFKPENVLVERGSGRVRVTDFGLARSPMRTGSAPLAAPELQSHTAKATPFEDDNATEPDVTRASAVVGTPAYMAPEQWTASAVDARADQFSFCVVLFEALTGQRPFATPGRFGVPVWPTTPRFAVSRELQRAVLRGLSVDPAQRFASLDPLLTLLERPPRQGRGRLLAAAAMVLGVATTMAVLATRTPPCTDVARPLDTAWSSAQQAAVKQSVGDETFAALRDRFEGFTREWAAQASENCEASVVRRAQPELQHAARESCLRRQLASFTATVQQLSSPQSAAIPRARELAQQLPRPEECADVARLLSVAPPTSAQAAEVDTAQQQLAALQVQLLAGDWKAGQVAMQALLARATTLGYRPLIAQVTWVLGWFALRMQQYDAAEASWRAALLDALAVKDDVTATRAATDLAFVIAHGRADFSAARANASLAASLVERTGHDADLEGRLENTLGAVAQEGEKWVEAKAHAERALALRLRLYPREHPETLKVLGNLALVEARQGHHAEAAKQLAALVALERTSLGPRHPMVAGTLIDLADSVERSQGVEPALAPMREAIALREAGLGLEHPATIASHSDFAVVLERAGRFDEARGEHERAISLAAKAFGEGSLQHSVALEGLARHESKRQRFAESLQAWNRVLADDRTRDGDAGAETTSARRERALVLGELGRNADAIAELRATLQQVEPRDGAEQATTLAVLRDLGALLLRAKQPASARGVLSRAFAGATAQGWPPNELGALEFLLAQALWAEPSQRVAALQHADAAEQLLLHAEPKPTLELAALQAWRQTHRDAR